ncbi:hypothetical protein JXA59_02960 [Patescibacteria group bacterium]|nr:hypothetical protein [Patescibacteria group bacterium]
MKKRKAIYLDANADIASTLSKLSRLDAEEIILAVPKGSVLFHSLVNLKIIKAEVDGLGKRLILVTTDVRGRVMAERADISTSSDLELPEEDEGATAVAVSTKPAASPIARPGGFKNEAKLTYKKRKLPATPAFKLTTARPDTPTAKPPSTTTRSKGNWGRGSIVVGFVVLALLVMGALAYFVLPHATVNLDISAEPFNHKFKLVVADQDDKSAAGQNLFKGRFVEVTKEVVQTFEATGGKNRGNAAGGTITVYNYTSSLKGLIPETRFVAPSGLVFRIKADVLVAPAKRGADGSLIPGRTNAKVVADSGGTIGNLPTGTKLTIPGLGAAGIDQVYGKSDEPFVGGTDSEIKIVVESDIESAKESISKNVFLNIEEELRAKVSRGEELVPQLIQNDVIDSVPSVAAGAERESFDLKVQVRSWTLLPDKDRLAGIINNTVQSIVPRDQVLTPQTISSARVVLDNADFLMHTIDFTVELDGLIAPKLDLGELAGSISNRSVVEAGKLFDSLPKVISHKIKLWPFWTERLPILESNIRINLAYINQAAGAADAESASTP